MTHVFVQQGEMLMTARLPLSRIGDELAGLEYISKMISLSRNGHVESPAIIIVELNWI